MSDNVEIAKEIFSDIKQLRTEINHLSAQIRDRNEEIMKLKVENLQMVINSKSRTKLGIELAYFMGSVCAATITFTTFCLVRRSNLK